MEVEVGEGRKSRQIRVAESIKSSEKRSEQEMFRGRGEG